MRSDTIQASRPPDADRYGTGWLVLRLLFALIVGYGAVVALGFASFPLIHNPVFHNAIANLLLAVLTSLCGGILSGGIMGPALHRRRWAFLYLAAESPAMPIWLTWLAEYFGFLPGPLPNYWHDITIQGLEIPDVFTFCLPALAGAAAGYWFRSFRRNGASLVAHFIVALTGGLAAPVALLMAALYSVGTSASPARIWLFMALASSGGGIVSGCIMQPAVSTRRWRFLYLAATSPAFAALAVYDTDVPDSFGYFTVLILIFWAGALAGYAVRHFWHRKRARSPESGVGHPCG